MKKKYYYNISYEIELGKCFSVGTVTGPAKARAKSKVTLTLSIDPGYKLSFLKVVEKQQGATPGQTILDIVPSEIIAGAQTYSFQMPSIDVTISADFEQIIDGTYKGHSYVIIKDVAWATTNLGAGVPSEPGQFFAWADIDVNDKHYPYYVENARYTEATTQGTSSSVRTFRTKYTDPNSVLEDADDAACLIGDNYQMPAEAHWQELIDAIEMGKIVTSFDSVTKYITLKVSEDDAISFTTTAVYLSRNLKSRSQLCPNPALYCTVYSPTTNEIKPSIVPCVNYAEARIRPIYTGEDTPENYVDFKLPSGVKWSKYDLDGFTDDTCTTIKMADSVDGGSLYWWGDVKPEGDDHEYSSLLTYVSFTDYNLSDSETLRIEDDAAHVNWGDGWRIPTKAYLEQLNTCFSKIRSNYQCQKQGAYLPQLRMPTQKDWVELYNNCTFEIADTTIDGKFFYLTKCTSKINNASILIPRAGYNLAYYGTGYYRGSTFTNSMTPSSPRLRSSGELLEPNNIESRVSCRHSIRGVSDAYIQPDIDAKVIDLGLPSGVCWLDRNVGAKDEYDYGDYYIWGSVEPNGTTNPSVLANGKVTKYCVDASVGNDGFTDGLTKLLPLDDAVTYYYSDKTGDLFDAAGFEYVYEDQEDPTKSRVLYIPYAGYLDHLPYDESEPRLMARDNFKGLYLPRYWTLCNRAMKLVSCWYGSSIRPVLMYDCIVSLNPDDWASISFDKDFGYYPGAMVTITISPKDGYSFTSITAKTTDGTIITVNTEEKEGKIIGTFTMPFSDVNLTVIGEDVSNYSITINSSSFGTVTADKATAKSGETITLTATPNTGYEFDKFTVLNASGSEITVTNNQFVMPASAVTVSATFKAIDYAINIDESIVNGAVSVVPADKATANYDEEVTLKVEPATGYKLAELTVLDADQKPVNVSEEYKFTMPASAVTVSATFKAIDYAINIDPEIQNGEIKVASGANTAHFGDVVTLTVTPATGYKLDELTVLDADQKPVNVSEEYKFTMPASAVTVSATFKAIDYAINIDPEIQNGEIKVASGANTAHFGDVVTLTVTPATGYKLAELTVLDADQKPVIVSEDYTFKMPAGAVTVNATFKALPDTKEAVDLGLSVKWATCNVGATTPEAYGNYYAWGETEPKQRYDWDTYKYGSGQTALTKYCNNSGYGTVDNLTTLEASDDVAAKNWGDKWRMPTDAEWTELRTNCTWTWTSNYNNTGVAGYEVKASNGNSIFLPAASFRNNDDLNNAGSVGIYWSSSLNINISHGAQGVYFNSGSTKRTGVVRTLGLSVRPVQDAQ